MTGKNKQIPDQQAPAIAWAACLISLILAGTFLATTVFVAMFTGKDISRFTHPAAEASLVLFVFILLRVIWNYSILVHCHRQLTKKPPPAEPDQTNQGTLDN